MRGGTGRERRPSMRSPGVLGNERGPHLPTGLDTHDREHNGAACEREHRDGTGMDAPEGIHDLGEAQR